MIDRILNMLGIGDGSFNKQGTTRRKHQRHAGMLADVIVADRAYGVKDWSTGGVYFDATPETRLNVGDKVQFLLRFRLPNETVNIMQTGKIVRAVRKGQSLSWSDVAMDTTTHAYRIRRDMEAQFAPPQRKAA